jgi:ankyrin repeat protein
MGDSYLLIEFSKRGQVDQIEAQLDGGAPINKGDGLGCTALHWAASGGHTDAIEFLISKGANVNAVAKDGDTPLHKAAWRNHGRAASLLIQKGADRKIKNSQGKIAAEIARDNGVKRICTPLPEVGETTNPLLRALEEAALMDDVDIADE